MKYDSFRELRLELKKIIINNTVSQKTLWVKLEKLFKENNELFKYKYHQSISEWQYNELLRSERCFNFLKSGFFSREKLAGSYLISEIVAFNSYVGEKYDFVLKNGTAIPISKQDYKDLEFLFK